MDFGIIAKNYIVLLKGVQVTLYVSFFSILIGSLCSILLGIVFVAGSRPVKTVISAYIFVMRGLPFLLIVFVIFYVLPFLGIRLSAIASGILSLTLYFVATGTEIVRGSIQAVSKGQYEAAYALGMTYWEAMRWAILPQALISMVPPFMNEFVYLLKGSSVVSIAGVPDLMGRGKEIIEREFRGFEILLTIGVIYYCLSVAFTYGGKRLEKRLAFKMSR
jgi:His/Glu/Gln/Arg/opine family amino acid ABC transporter permease subunit